jgi:hypothetical protein
MAHTYVYNIHILHIYSYIYIYMWHTTYQPLHILVHTNMGIHMYIQMCMYMYENNHIFILMQVSKLSFCMCMHIWHYFCTYMHIYACMCMFIYIYIYNNNHMCIHAGGGSVFFRLATECNGQNTSAGIWVAVPEKRSWKPTHGMHACLLCEHTVIIVFITLQNESAPSQMTRTYILVQWVWNAVFVKRRNAHLMLMVCMYVCSWYVCKSSCMNINESEMQSSIKA